MSSRLDWRRVHKFPGKESKYGAGVILNNGVRAPSVPPDSLSRRANQALRLWLRSQPASVRDDLPSTSPYSKKPLRKLGGGR